LNPRGIEWTEISREGKEELVPLLKGLAQSLRKPFPHKPSLREARSVPKEKRNEFRRQWIKTEQAKCAGYGDYVLLRSSVALGINSVSKALERNQLAGVIIEQNVNPQILTKVLVPLANSKNIPIISCDSLKSSFQGEDGKYDGQTYRCSALGLKKSCEEISHTFHPLLTLIRDLSQKLEPDNFCNNYTPISAISSPHESSALNTSKS